MIKPLVYLSYRWEGAKEYADRLADWLHTQPSIRVFGDRSIEPGEHWPSALQANLERASALIVLIDSAWLKYQDDFGRRKLDDPDDWIHREISQTLSRQCPILPILIEDARMPPAQALPKPLQKLVEFHAVRLRSDTFDHDVSTLIPWLRKLTDEETTSINSSESLESLRIKRLVISGFRCFEELELDLDQESTLAGNWTCVGGINGAGKSSILQAISLLMMGPNNARELGGRRLQAMRRLDAKSNPMTSVLKAWVEHFGTEYYLELVISDDGPSDQSESGNSHPFWRIAENLTVAGYGASRNFSDSSDRWETTSAPVRAHVTLFDPMARTAMAPILLDDKSWNSAPEEHKWTAWKLFEELIGNVLAPEQLTVGNREQDSKLFTVAGSPVRVLDLPDGFRSSVSWMADLCVRLSKQGSSLKDMTGIALVDEVDLHLHPSLQRAIIPRLRDALPQMQFIVTSHSPLILSSFDRNELVLLDNNAEGGTRRLDRQIIGFSSDEIYNWLMETSPHSLVWDRKLADESEPNLGLMMYQSANPAEDEDFARRQQERELETLKDMGIEEGDEF